MNVKLFPATVISSLENQNAVLDIQRDNYQSVVTAIEAYREEHALAGRAFGAHKNYFGEGHLPFITAYRRIMLSQRNANVSHIGHLRALTHDYYNQQQIESELNQLFWSIAALRASIALAPLTSIFLRNLLNTRLERQRLLREKRDQLNTYMANTRTLYSGVESQLQNVQRLLLRLEMQTKCEATGVVSLPSMEEVDQLIALREMVESWINEDGTMNWDVLREVGWDDLVEGLRYIKGEDVLAELLAQVAIAEGFLEVWEFPSPPNDPMLLLQKLQDRIIMEAIYEMNQDSRFSIEVWSETDFEGRQRILQEYQDAIVAIFGVTIVDEVFFFDPEDPDNPRSPRGNYSHFGNSDRNREPLTVGINN